MGATSAIEWTEATWNPLVGCTSVSPGCDNCYARTQVNTRFHPAALAKGGRHLEAFPAPFDKVSIRPDRFLTQPLHWSEPKRIFVNSLSDLFHHDVPVDFIDQVFGVMAANLSHTRPTHTFQLLTKRHARMRSYLSNPDARHRIALAAAGFTDDEHADAAHDFILYGNTWPLPNVWLGVSVENQQWADIRIPALLDTPAAVRWISAEPLLGPVELTYDRFCKQMGWGPPAAPSLHISIEDQLRTQATWLLGPSSPHVPRINWVVAGGESGPGARPMHPDWARSLRDQCVAAGVPFLFKQWGNWAPRLSGGVALGDVCMSADGDTYTVDRDYICAHNESEGEWLRNVGKKAAAGRVLDGRTWSEYPHAR